MAPPILSLSQTHGPVKSHLEGDHVPESGTIAELWDVGSVVMMVRNVWDRPS